MQFTDKTYTILKYVASIGLPAFATLVSTIGVIWNIPVAIPIVLTIVAINTFVGTLVGISSFNYNKD